MPPERCDDAIIEQRIGYCFVDKSLLAQALTHRSAAATHNQRLEFLGDAVIGFVLAELFYGHEPPLEEGEMTRRRAMLICGPALVEIAHDLGIPEHLRLGESEATPTGRNRPSTLEDAVEAIVGAVYLDGGISKAKAVIEAMYGSIDERIEHLEIDHNPKGRLQELTQAALRLQAVEYHLVGVEGNAPHQEFQVEVAIDGVVMGSGYGRTKKAAEEEAARDALTRLDAIE
jgi:ribonuclease-3